MFSWLQSWSRALNQGLGLVAKSSCVLCQRLTSQVLCLDCQRQVMQCQFTSPSWVTVAQMPVFAWGGYQGALKQAIAALKYHNQPQLATQLGSWMATTWRQQPAPTTSAIVVPIPMHAAKQKQRGFNQAELLAQSFCAMTGLPLEARGLVRLKATEAQFRLSGVARSQNVKDAFGVGAPFVMRSPRQPVLLLDDIFTTGSTAISAAKTLRAHGIRVEGIIVLASAQLSSEQYHYNVKG